MELVDTMSLIMTSQGYACMHVMLGMSFQSLLICSLVKMPFLVLEQGTGYPLSSSMYVHEYVRH